MVRSMVKNDNIDVTQRQPLNLDGTCGLLLYFLRVCEDTILSNSAKFFLNSVWFFYQNMKCQEPLCCSISVKSSP